MSLLADNRVKLYSWYLSIVAMFNQILDFIHQLFVSFYPKREDEEKIKAPPMPTEVSQKYEYLDDAIRLEEEINRNISLLGNISSQTEEDDIKMAIGMEINKAKLLKKGKLKMFRDLCMVSLNEIDPIENEREVTVNDLEGFWCLLDIEVEKYRHAVVEIIEPKKEEAKDVVKKVAVTTSSQKSKAAMKVKKSLIDERNRKYIERMKQLREKNVKAK